MTDKMRSDIESVDSATLLTAAEVAVEAIERARYPDGPDIGIKYMSKFSFRNVDALVARLKVRSSLC